MKTINTYTIQQWLFAEAEGQFETDLAESGIQYHYFHDLDLSKNYDLNYSLDRGKLALRELIAAMYGVATEQVTITHGAQEALYLFYRSFLTNKDHMITFAPGWQQAWEVPHCIGSEVTLLQLSATNDYRIDMAQLEKSIKPNTKLINLINPCNPTGVGLTDQEWKQLINLANSKGIFLLADEEYYTDYSSSLVNRYDNSAIVSSLSKVYGFPGLRLGWFISSKDLVEDVVNYRRYTSVSNSSLCEYLAMQVLQQREQHLAHYQQIVNEGYKILDRYLSTDLPFALIKPAQTPFVYLKTAADLDSNQFCKELLQKHKVLLMPGEVFADSHALRISIGRPEEILTHGLDKLVELYRDNYE